jgi:hypothetical protein
MIAHEKGKDDILRGIVLEEYGEYIAPGIDLLGLHLDFFLGTLAFEKHQRVLAIFETASQENAARYKKIYSLQEMLNRRFLELS